MLDWIASPAFVEVWAGGTWQLHLWFLVSLIPMFLLAAAVQVAIPKSARVRGFAVALSDRFGGLLRGSLPFAFGLLFLGFANTANYASASLVPGSYDLIAPGFQSWYKLTAEFPFFVIGVMAALSPRLLEALTQWRWWMPYAAAAALILQPYANPEQLLIEAVLMLFLNQLAIWVEFTVLTLAAAGTVVAIHELLVRRFAIWRLLANGKTDVEQVRKQPGLLAAFFSTPAAKSRPSGKLSPS